MLFSCYFIEASILAEEAVSESFCCYIVMFAANNCIVETRTNITKSVHFQMDTWCDWSWQSSAGRLALTTANCPHCTAMQSCSDRQ